MFFDIFLPFFRVLWHFYVLFLLILYFINKISSEHHVLINIISIKSDHNLTLFDSDNIILTFI